MPNRVAISKLNGSTLDIINTIRANASYEYQQSVPEISDVRDIPKVGEILYGYPALANQFINALVNRIALVRVKSATFNNAYAMLKKGYLEFGETVEEVFVNICKAREFSPEKAAAREFKRSLPDVRSAFHTMNFRVQYPITIQQEGLRMAFQSATGVQDLISKIVNAVYTAAEYDEFLLFKYLMIKAIAHGKMYPVQLGNTMSDAATAFRGSSNKLEFMKKEYNVAGVTTNTKKADQYIFMDSDFNAKFDVDVLAGAFNMEKATFIGKLHLIDDWTTFDNDRFSEIGDQLEPVTADELSLMAHVKAVLVDGEWFQFYDNLASMTEDYVAAGLYWNYFYNVWKTVSSSPFSNAIVFVDSTATVTAPETITMEITDKTIYEGGTIITVTPDLDDEALRGEGIFGYADDDGVEDGVAIHRFGAIVIPALVTSVNVSYTIGDTVYSFELDPTDDVGDTYTAEQPDTETD